MSEDVNGGDSPHDRAWTNRLGLVLKQYMYTEPLYYTTLPTAIHLLDGA